MVCGIFWMLLNVLIELSVDFGEEMGLVLNTGHFEPLFFLFYPICSPFVLR